MTATKTKVRRDGTIKGKKRSILWRSRRFFFLAFLPQFVSPGWPLVPQLAVMGVTCVVLNTAVDVVAVFASDRVLRSGAARSARAKLLNRTSGFTMLGLGAYLALARREA